MIDGGGGSSPNSSQNEVNLPLGKFSKRRLTLS
jgi:hypothetical protein